MGRPPCCDKAGIKKGPWTPEEDLILVSYIQEHGPGNWRSVPINTGLMRCSKSCRLRWTNYLRPGIKRGNFTPHEEGIIIHLQSLLGNRWAAIASYLPQRTDNDIKNYWNTHLKKKLKKHQAMGTLFVSSDSNMIVSKDYYAADKINPHSSFAGSADAGCASSSYASSMDNISNLLQGFMKSSPAADVKPNIHEVRSSQGAHHSLPDDGMSDGAGEGFAASGGGCGEAMQEEQAPLSMIEKWLFDEATGQVDLSELFDGCSSVPMLS